MTSAKTTISISEARKRIFDIANEVQAPHKAYTLTAGGKPKAVILSAEEYESWVETMEVLHDFPDLDKEVKEADKAVRDGTYKKWSTLEDMIAKRKDGVYSKNKTKGRKKS